MQQLNPSEISDIIKQRISQLDVASPSTDDCDVISTITQLQWQMFFPLLSVPRVYCFNVYDIDSHAFTQGG